jgi:hypothetical protein
MTPKRRSRLAPLALLVMLAGCQSLPSGLLGDARRLVQPDERALRAPLALAPAERPAYRVGDTFFFGRGSVRTVSAVSATAITWRSASTTPGEDVQTYRTAADLFAPVLDVTGERERSTSRIDNRQGTLWPLQAGRRASFDEWRRPDRAGATERRHRWTCEVGPARMVSVYAGDFPSYPVTCRARLDRFPLPTQVLTWDYAPSIGHYVRRTWMDNGRQRETQLSAALPAPLATPERMARVHERLQSAP